MNGAAMNWQTAAEHVRRRRWVQVLSTSLLFVTLATGPTLAGQPISAKMQAQFSRFHDALAGKQAKDPALRRAQTWVRACRKDWVLVADLVGNRIFRPADVLPHLAGTWQHAVSSKHEKLPLDEATRAELVRHTRRLASQLADIQPDTKARIYVKREIILVGRPGPTALKRYAGRFLVRLHKLPGGKYFQVVYSPDQRPIHVDTNVRDPACVALANALAHFERDPTIPAFEENRGGLILGTFFDPGEYRFELRAHSFEGEPFLDLSQRNEPFGRDHFDLSQVHLVDTRAYRRSKDYHYWCWRWWTRYGRVGAARGNWLPERSKWEHSNVEVRHHKNLADYRLVGGEPREIREYKKPDGKTYKYPFAYCEQFEHGFYDDVEQCHIVLMTTHGGHVKKRFRFRRNPDVWVEFKPTRNLGSGNLRHLFIEGCGAMTYVEEPKKRVLLKTWIESRFAAGIRTICGADGEHNGLDRSGWRFFGRYNKGDSISDAWAFRDMDECPENNPVTIAFGKTREAALDTLLNGRFTQRRARSKWVAVSVWTNP